MPTFFIQHTADVSRGGSAITTKEHCCKKTEGSSRFKLALEPKTTTEFVVSEEVTVTSTSTDLSDLLLHANWSWLRKHASYFEHSVLNEFFKREQSSMFSSLGDGNIEATSIRQWLKGSLYVMDETTKQPAALLSPLLHDLCSQVMASRAKESRIHVVIQHHEALTKKITANQDGLQSIIRKLEKRYEDPQLSRYKEDYRAGEQELQLARDKTVALKISLEKNAIHRSKLRLDLKESVIQAQKAL